MNKLLKKVIALGLSAALCLTGAGFAFADDGVKNEKDETVYVLAGADGGHRQRLVEERRRGGCPGRPQRADGY